jgi:hypothetical protein
LPEIENLRVLIYAPNRKYGNYLPSYFTLRTKQVTCKYDIGSTVSLLGEHDLLLCLDMDDSHQDQLNEYIFNSEKNKGIVTYVSHSKPNVQSKMVTATSYPLDIRNLRVIMTLQNSGMQVEPEFNMLGALKKQG